MKIRNGFVSNSSSSSFCIYGCKIDCEQYNKLEEDLIDLRKTSSIFKYIDMFAYSDCAYYIGREFKTIQDNETGQQFKLAVVTAIKTLLSDKSKFSTIEHAWYEG